MEQSRLCNVENVFKFSSSVDQAFFISTGG